MELLDFTDHAYFSGVMGYPIEEKAGEGMNDGPVSFILATASLRETKRERVRKTTPKIRTKEEGER